MPHGSELAQQPEIAHARNAYFTGVFAILAQNIAHKKPVMLNYPIVSTGCTKTSSGS